MKEKPILFKAAMVLAIQSGNKTQTRRIVATDTRPQSEDTFMRGFPPNPTNVRMGVGYAKCDAPAGSRSVSYRVRCPYGYIEDRLWVKETFWHRNDDGLIAYAADGNISPGKGSLAQQMGIQNIPAGGALPDAEMRKLSFVKKPSIFMPRTASRITLEITGVRVERLQDISDDDARDEGADHWFNNLHPDHPEPPSSSKAFKMLWVSINGKQSWDLNPYVWVIEFKKV